jgi:uncharacterized protein (TIGR02246 family)
MRTRLLWFMALAAMTLGVTAPPASARQPQGDPKDVAALQKAGEAFIEAFDKGDARALAAFWVEDGDFTDQTGRHLQGRAALEKAFQQAFSDNKGLKLRINSASLRFLTPDVAVEDGTTEVIPADGGPPTSARYTIVHVKKNGAWLLGSVRNAPAAPSGTYEHLRDLEGLVGDWAEGGGKGEGERLALAWAEGQSFLVGTFSKTFRNAAVANARQIIGWDPVAKALRSWIFDASGAFGEGTWTRDGRAWVIKTTSVFPDGKKGSATFVLTPVDADTLTLQGKGRTVDGTAIPDSQAITLKRTR